MKLLIRYFFKAAHAVVGPVLLAGDRLTAPRPIQRSPAEQEQVDEQTRNLVMYQFLACPFCIKTRRAIRRLALNIDTRDALRHATSRQQLLEGGGQIKVPCLRITDAEGRHEWMYESSDIIRYLQNRFGSR
jgi:glutaredoxin